MKNIVYVISALVLLSGCISGRTLVTHGSIECQIAHEQVTLLAAYGLGTCLNEKGELVAMDLEAGKSIGEAGMNIALTAGAIAAGVTAIKGIETTSEIVLPAILGME